MNDQEKRFGIHKKYGVDIEAPKQKRVPQFYQLVEYGPYGRKILHAQVYPSQYAILVSKKKELIRNSGNHFISNTGFKLKIEAVY